MQELSTTKFHGAPSRCARADGRPLNTASVCPADSSRAILPCLVARAEELVSPIGTKRMSRAVRELSAFRAKRTTFAPGGTLMCYRLGGCTDIGALTARNFICQRTCYSSLD